MTPTKQAQIIEEACKEAGLEKAFQTANVVLQAMSRIAKEENDVQSKI